MVCDAATFKSTALQSERLISRVMRHEQTLFAQAQQSTACMANHEVEARLCRWLLRARDLAGSDHLPFTQEFLAECPTHNDCIWCQALASRRVRVRMWATNAQATALAIVASKSFASLRQRPSHAKVRSTTHLRGRTSKPCAVSERLMISIVHSPIASKPSAIYLRHSHRRQRYG